MIIRFYDIENPENVFPNPADLLPLLLVSQKPWYFNYAEREINDR